jgi:hypothetical protein
MSCPENRQSLTITNYRYDADPLMGNSASSSALAIKTLMAVDDVLVRKMEATKDMVDFKKKNVTKAHARLRSSL